MKIHLCAALVMLVGIWGCSGGNGSDVIEDVVADTVQDVAADVPADVADIPEDAAVDAGADVAVDTVVGPSEFSVMTFNTGTTNNFDHSYDTDGYTADFSEINSEYFGNNLAWTKARDYIRKIVDLIQPDILNFQELFFDPECESICSELTGTATWTTVCDPDDGVFVCSVWEGVESSELTVRAAVGPDYEIACAPNHNDNCVAIRKDFGTIAISAGATDTAGAWIDGLDGMPPPNGCTNGARVATGVVSVTDGPEITVVDVHTVSGTNQECRLAQFQQVFEDRGDGKPAAFGEHNIVMGDMNIDPFLMSDDSVDYWNSQVGADKPFHYISSSDASGPMTHPVSFSKLDHVISNDLIGQCVVLGVSEWLATDLFPPTNYFDHRPVLCTIEMP